jgi:hypothetical protein
MLLTTTTYKCTEETGPKYWLAWTEGNDLQAQNFGYITPGYQISTGQQYLEILDDEAALSARVEAVKGDGDWYWQCDVRIQSPPQPNEWVCDTETGYSVPSPVQPEMSEPGPEPTPEI